MPGLGLGVGARHRRQGTPSGLFFAGEQGVWYDPSDLSTLFQDAAGTTPVTAVEQPVGKMLDKSGRGNHATQTTSTSRPVLSARYNLLTKTEQFDDVVWATVAGTKPTAQKNQLSPDGLLNGWTLTAPGTALSRCVQPNFQFLAGRSVVLSFLVKRGTRAEVILGTTQSSAASFSFNFDTRGIGGTNGAYTNSRNAFYIGDGWYKLQWVITNGATDRTEAFGLILDGWAAGETVFVYAASLVPADQANLPYQRVNTATDYDADPAKFPKYLKCDGVDDGMVTNSIDFTATDKMTVFAGVRKLSDAATACVIEFSSNINNNDGAFSMFSSGIAFTDWNFASKGTFRAAVQPLYPAPTTNVLTGLGNISGDSAILRVNGAQAASSTADQGTGNYGNYPLYIGRRGGTTLPFNGHIYSLIVRGAATTDAKIAQTEKWLAKKTGVTL